MPFNFHIEGPQEKADRALKNRLMEQELTNEGLRNQVLQASVDQINPDTEKIRSILQQREQEMDPVARKALEVNLSRFGTYKDDSLGTVPVFMPQDEVRQRRANTFIRNAEDLAAAENAIRQAEQSGNIVLAQAMRTQMENMYKGSKENFKKVPFEQLDKLTKRRAFLDGAEKVAAQLARPGSSGLYGPFDSFAEDIRGRFGLGGADYARLNQAFSMARNALVNELSGAAVTPEEMERQLETIGNITRADFATKFMEFYSQRRQDFYNQIQTLSDAGYQIPDKLVTRSEQGVNMGGQSSASPAAPSGQGQGTFQYNPKARRNIGR